MGLEAIIYKKLPDFTIDLRFRAPAEDILAMVGPSGSGKTTIMRILAGLERPDKGRIICNGRVWLDTAQNIFLAPQQRNIGYVFQEYSLFPHLTVEKNVAFAAPDRDLVEQYLDHFRIGHLKKRKPARISGGERQRVALAQALARKPELLLLDEPFSALDQVTRKILHQALIGLKARIKIPMVHVSHNLEDVLGHAEQVIAVEQGKLAPGWLAGVLGGGSLAGRDRGGREKNPVGTLESSGRTLPFLFNKPAAAS